MCNPIATDKTNYQDNMVLIRLKSIICVNYSQHVLKQREKNFSHRTHIGICVTIWHQTVSRHHGGSIKGP